MAGNDKLLYSWSRSHYLTQRQQDIKNYDDGYGRKFKENEKQYRNPQKGKLYFVVFPAKILEFQGEQVKSRNQHEGEHDRYSRQDKGLEDDVLYTARKER